MPTVCFYSRLKSTALFPIDVWIGRIMRSLYLGESATMKEIFEIQQ
ncbi:MAG: hypothetical protein L6V93_10085 [Clostridiales bacterium]|nr:MAG: hypothetical protein L6V93_10085 [Clostridiales bacterium]